MSTNKIDPAVRKLDIQRVYRTKNRKALDPGPAMLDLLTALSERQERDLEDNPTP